MDVVVVVFFLSLYSLNIHNYENNSPFESGQLGIREYFEKKSE